MPSNIGQMAQLISALASIQTQRREMDLREKQYETSKQQFAQSFGLDEKSKQYKQIADLVDASMRSTSESRGGFIELGRALGLPEDQLQAFAHVAQTAPETVEAIRNRAATQGVASMNPQMRGQMNQEAATAATTGMNQGQMANSGLQAILARGAQGAVTPAMQQGYAQRSATNQTPLEALVQATIAQNPDMRGRMAGIMAGTATSAAQDQQAEIGRGGVQAEFGRIREESIYHQMEIAERIATAKGQGSLTPGLADMAGKMIEAAKAVVDPKSDDAARTQAKALYDRLADMIGWSDLKWRQDGAGGPAGVIDRARSSISPYNVPNPPAAPPSIPPSNVPPTAPFMSTPVMPQFQMQNPLQQFVRPPQ